MEINKKNYNDFSNSSKTNLFISTTLDFNTILNKLNLIINADDLGICEERDEGIFEIFQKGVITSSTILVNGVNFENSIKKAKEFNLPLGIHINLTEGEPVYKNKLHENSLVSFDYISNSYKMHGKFEFRQRVLDNQIREQDIKNEIIHQILKFIEFYGNIPTHIDGHQHIHVIPKIALIIAPLISNYFGIYQTRIPKEEFKFLKQNYEYDNSLRFYTQVISESKISMEIYSQYNINFPNFFIGMSTMGINMTEDHLQENFSFIKNKIIEKNEIENQIEQKLFKKEYFIELMCHPGNVPSSFYWDDFNSSNDRIHEKKILEKYFIHKREKEQINFVNFLDLTESYFQVKNDIIITNNNKQNILLIGDFTFGTGNSTTAIRLQSIFQKLEYNVFLYNIKYINNDSKLEDRFYKSLQKFIINKKINLIIGIHLWRSGRVLNKLRKLKENFLISSPYILIVSGTDANDFINREEERQEIRNAINNSEKIISFNEEMISKLEEKLAFKLNYEIIPQSVNIHSYNDCELTSNFSIRKKFNIPDDYKITLFPSGIRKIKDPLFIFNQILEILNEFNDHIIILIGAKLDNILYEKINSMIKNSKFSERFLLHDPVLHIDFLNILKESQLVINSSISEGMSNVLMESMQMGVPVLARSNEGNNKLIRNFYNGVLFSTQNEFVKFYKQIYQEEDFKNSIIKNAKSLIQENYSIQSEIRKYKLVLDEVENNFYKNLKCETFDHKLLFLKNVHPFSDENNIIFSHAKLQENLINNKLNILDAGCGAGIFSFLFLLKNKNLKVNELVLIDIEENCIFSSFQNFVYFKEYFNIEKVTLIQSDLLKSLTDGKYKKEYFKYFDVVLANMPQTPSLNPIRSKNKFK